MKTFSRSLMEVRSLQPNALVINESDNVAVTLEDIRKGEAVRLGDGRLIEAAEDIPYSHKVALCDLAPGEDVLKYGEIIGQAKQKIKTGDWVHVHNLVVED